MTTIQCGKGHPGTLESLGRVCPQCWIEINNELTAAKARIEELEKVGDEAASVLSQLIGKFPHPSEYEWKHHALNRLDAVLGNAPSPHPTAAEADWEKREKSAQEGADGNV